MKKSRKILALFLGLLMSVSLFSGCGGSNTEESSGGAGLSANSGEKDTNTGNTDGKKVLRIGTGQSCGTLDPLQSYDGWYAIRFGFGQTLTKLEDDFSVSPWLVEDGYTVSDDNTTWTFTIRKDVTFSNGTPLTAELAKASIENVFKNGTRGPEYFTCTSMEADGQTLTIHTENPEPILPNKLADPLFTIIDTSVDMSNIAEKGPVGTGPFVVKSFDSVTKECVVEKNANYWNGDVAVDEIIFSYTEDQPALSMALQVGEFDAVYNVSMSDISDYINNDAYKVSTCAGGRTTHGFMNQNGLLGDEVLRQAIIRYIDRETYCKMLLNDQYVAGKTLITSSASYGFDELTDINAYDPEGAVKLLDDAGYVDSDGDGVRETPDGKPLKLNFVYYTGRPEQQIVVETTQQELAKIGISIIPEVYDTQTVINKLGSGDYDMLCMSINVLNCGDPENHMATYFKTGGSYNAYGYSSREFDSLMDQLSVTADAKERIELVKKAEQILMDDSVCIYFCYPIMNFVMKSNVSGVNSTPADFYWVDEKTTIE